MKFRIQAVSKSVDREARKPRGEHHNAGSGIAPKLDNGGLAGEREAYGKAGTNVDIIQCPSNERGNFLLPRSFRGWAFDGAYG
jgi:hypothetical protein